MTIEAYQHEDMQNRIESFCEWIDRKIAEAVNDELRLRFPGLDGAARYMMADRMATKLAEVAKKALEKELDGRDYGTLIGL